MDDRGDPFDVENTYRLQEVFCIDFDPLNLNLYTEEREYKIEINLTSRTELHRLEKDLGIRLENKSGLIKGLPV